MTSNPPLPARKSHRLWFPLGIALVAAFGIFVIRRQEELERLIQLWLTGITVLLALLLLLIWFLCLSRFSWRTRLVTLGCLALAGFGLTRLLRVDGSTDGTGLPRLAWKWSPQQLERFDNPPPATTQSELAAADVRLDLPDVPQFFGPNRDGTIRDAKPARDWKITPPKLLWRQPIGLGWSSFAIAAGRAYTQEQRGDAELVTCYNPHAGRLIWAHTNRVRFSHWQGGDGPRATPTVAQGQVFAYGATGILDCLDARSGTSVWERDVLKENNLPNLTWGISCSPLVFDDTVVVTGGFTNGPTVLAYHRLTGEPRWRAGTDKAGYASPVLATLAGKRLVLSVNAGSLTAHDPLTGMIVFEHPWSNEKPPKASQPMVLEGDRIFLSAGYGIGCLMLQVQTANDGKLVTTVLWKARTLKTQFNSATARDGFLYGLDDGVLTCIDSRTGERKWKEGRYGSGQTLIIDDLVLIQSEPGDVVLAQAKPDAFQELARLPALNRKTWNYPTLAGRYLLVRNDQEAAGYELPSSPR